MYQFFVDHTFEIGDTISLDKAQEHHAKNVVRLNNEIVRIVSNGIGYYGKGYVKDNQFYIDILEKDSLIRELPYQITLAIALIRREKMELILQKATELGVHTIIPFISSRCVVQEKKEKGDKLMERWNRIVQESCAQCKRDKIPTISSIQKIEDLYSLSYENKYIANSDLDNPSPLFQSVLNKGDSMIVIGPEGGFSVNEIEHFKENGFTSVSFGNRILRAETAAIYAMSLLSSYLDEVGK